MFIILVDGDSVCFVADSVTNASKVVDGCLPSLLSLSVVALLIFSSVKFVCGLL